MNYSQVPGDDEDGSWLIG